MKFLRFLSPKNPEITSKKIKGGRTGKMKKKAKNKICFSCKYF